MNNKFKDIYEILKKDKRLISEDGNLLKNKLYTLAMNMDETLLQILVSHDITRDLFFKKIDDILVFDKVKFSWLIDSKDFLPDSYTAFKNKIMLTDDMGNSIKNSSDVVLSFPFKDCVLEADSTKDKEEREEVFLNEVLMKKEIDTLLAPKVFTNTKKYSLNGGEDIQNLNNDDNLIIKGNNLLVLHSLIPRYKGKIKCMYWDILYNTNNDNVPYNDSFKHASWLTMMKNRLEVAKELLSEDGVIFIQLDDNEQAYLTVLCDELFGRENRINIICVNMSNVSGKKIKHAMEGKRFPKTKEYILVYAKSKAKLELDIPKLPKNKWDNEYNKIIPQWSMEDYELMNSNNIDLANKKIQNYKLLSLVEYCKENNIKLNDEWKLKNSYRIFATKPNDSLLKKYKNSKFNNDLEFVYNESKNIKLIFTDFNKETETARIELASALINNTVYTSDNWIDICTTGGTSLEGNVKLNNGKKPERLIERIIKCSTKEGDIVLDAYLGSGTTASVCHKMNRKYIGIEQLNSHFDISTKRLQNVIGGDKTGISKSQDWNGGGSFISCELKTLGQEFVEKLNSCDENELNRLYIDLKNNEFITYRVDINKLEQNQEGFNSLTEDEKRKFLIQVIDKNLLYVNYSEIDDESYNISEEDKLFNRSFYKKEI